MTTENPEFLSTADLSPLSPSPIHTHTSSPTLVPALQDQAAALDVAPFPDPAVAIIMVPTQDAPEISDTIVVGGDYSDDSLDASDDSFDAYGQDEEGNGQESRPEASHNDDYAGTFDSPAGREQQEQQDSEAESIQSDVSQDSQSMNNSSTLDPIMKKSQSPIAPTASALPSSSDLPPGNATVQQQSPSTSDESVLSVSKSPSESQSAPPNASPSPPPGSAKPAPKESKVNSAHVHALARSSPSPPATAKTATSPTSANEDDAATVDIQRLVNDITARADATDSPPRSPKQATLASQAATTSSLNLSHHASLPPKPAVPQKHSHLPSISQPRPPNKLPPLAASMSNANPPAPRGGYLSSGGAPGTTPEGIASLPPPPPTSFNAAQPTLHPLPPNIHLIPGPGDVSLQSLYAPSRPQEWETFMADEKRYTAEAKWERFPDGSRLFIGNLSSDRVSKREVFNVFHKFGRLAQISLKSAFGFVQYHTAEEGKLALLKAQGIELGGRKIHLEISRTKKKEDRNRSPDRRDPRAGRGVDRFDNGDRNRRRDDFRSARSPSPRRNEPRAGSRDGFYPRDREPGNAFDRRRSRSPSRFSRRESDAYRRRSPSPPRRAPADQLDIPRRYGDEVPDVQLLLLQDVERGFVDWVQRTFQSRGLKTDVMFLSPRFPREALVQRQVLEGVHAIVDLDYTAQAQGKLSIQVFSRSGGSNVHFESFQGITPAIATELVFREKYQAPPPSFQPPVPQHQPTYPPAYPTDPSVGYPYPYPQAPVQAQPAAPAPDLASLVGQLNNTDLQALLASLQANSGAVPHQASHLGISGNFVPGGGAQHSQMDISRLLGSLGNIPTSQPAPAISGQPSYGPTPTYISSSAGPLSPTNAGPNAAIVQNIMDQLKRAAQ